MFSLRCQYRSYWARSPSSHYHFSSEIQKVPLLWCFRYSIMISSTFIQSCFQVSNIKQRLQLSYDTTYSIFSESSTSSFSASVEEYVKDVLEFIPLTRRTSSCKPEKQHIKNFISQLERLEVKILVNIKIQFQFIFYLYRILSFLSLPFEHFKSVQCLIYKCFRNFLVWNFDPANV